MVTTVYESDSAGRFAEPGHSRSGVSWAAIFAGALAAGILSVLLFMLGIGLGLSSVSVWSGQGSDGATVGWGAIAWLVVTQLLSAAVGGYLAGRLRTKWQGGHSDDIYFRDTAHGFLSWALATICMIALSGSILGSVVSTAGKAASSVASGAAQVVGGVAGAVTDVAGGAATAVISGAAGAAMDKKGPDLQYWINSLMRQGGPTDKQKQDVKDAAQDVARKAQSAADDARDVSVIFTHAMQDGKLSDEDADYVARLVSQRADISQDEAKERVQEAFKQVQDQVEAAKQKAKELEENAKQAAEKARKATAYSLLWMFVVLLIGAFVGSFSATLGGKQRDSH